MTIGVAVILAALAGALHWKHRAPRAVAWLLLLAGIGLASVAAQYIGALTHLTVLGYGITVPLVVVLGVLFWEEAVRRNGMHRVRTPIAAVMLGVLLLGLGGSVGHGIASLAARAGSGVGQVTHSLTGGG